MEGSTKGACSPAVCWAGNELGLTRRAVRCGQEGMKAWLCAG